MSPGPDTQDNNSSVMMASPPAAEGAMISGSDTAAGIGRGAVGKTEAGNDDGAVMENPYLAVLGKKTRGLRKKMEKIKKTENLSASGKHLNEEQIKLLETKPQLEIALAEHERVRAVIQAVAKEQAEQQAAEAEAERAKAELLPSQPPSSSPPALSIPSPESEPTLCMPPPEPDAADCERDVQEEQEQEQAQEAAVVVAPTTESVGVATELTPMEEAAAQTDVSGPPPPPGLDPREVSAAVAAAAATAAEEKRKGEAEAEARGVAAGRAEAAAGVAKLLRLLHVASRFEAKGDRLPTAVDFFSKVLLGKTVPPDEADFDGCLDQSVERAILYLDPLNSNREVAPGVSFQGLEDIVSALREQIIAPPAAQGPVFNFFGDASPSRNVQVQAQAQGGASRVAENDEDASRDAGPVVPASGNNQPKRPAPTAEPSVVVGEEASGYQASQASPAPGGAEVNERPMVLPLPGPLAPPPRPMADSGTPLPVPSAHGLAAGDESTRSPTAGQLGRQASQMEEGVLPPVVTQTHSHPTPPVLAVDPAVAKRERRTKPRSRPPAPSYTPVHPGHQYAPQPRHTMVPSPPLPHPLHVRSPFPQQPTPPLTPVQMGQGLAPPVPSPSPPAGAQPPAGVPGGSPNLTYGGAWGYPQPPQALLSQQQQYSSRPPLPSGPVTMRPDHRTVNAPWGDPSPQMYPAVAPTAQSASPRRGALKVQDTLAGEFSLEAENVQGPNPSRGHTTSNSGAPPQPLPPSIAPPGQWENLTSAPPPPTQATASVLDLERGMTSPWQGVPQDAGASAPPGLGAERCLTASVPPGLVPQVTSNLAESTSMERRAPAGINSTTMDPAGGRREKQSFVGTSMNTTPERQLNPVEVEVGLTATPLVAVEAPTPAPTSAEPTPNTEASTAGKTIVANGNVPSGPGTTTNAAPPKPRGGNSRARATGSRGRGGRRSEAIDSNEDRNAAKQHDGAGGGSSSSSSGGKDSSPLPANDQAPPASDERALRGGVDTVGTQPPPKQVKPQRQDQAHAPRNAKAQRRPREQGRAQPQRQEQVHRVPEQQQQQKQQRQEQQGQRQDPVTTQPHRNTRQDHGRPAPQSKGRAPYANAQPVRQPQNQTNSSSPAPKNGWSNGAPAAQSASTTPALAPTPAPAPTRASKSWADDEPSSSSGSPPAPQRATGGRRNRQPSHQKLAQDAKRPADTRGQGTHEQWQDSAPSHEQGSREDMQHGRGNQRYAHGGGRGHVANGTVGGAGGGGAGGAPPAKTRGQVQGVGKSGGASIESQNRGQHADARVRAEDGGSGRMGNSSAPQGSGARKNRAPPLNRRRGGGGGGGGGRGSQQQQQQQQQQRQQQGASQPSA